jgi:hypothetical protein
MFVAPVFNREWRHPPDLPAMNCEFGSPSLEEPMSSKNLGVFIFIRLASAVSIGLSQPQK